MSDTRHFVIVGGMRCGSTYLARLLAAQPGIRMATPIIPEPKYFLRDGVVAEGIEAYHRTCFGPIQEGAVLGEKSVSYLETPIAATRIQQLLPDARILIILRDPVLRAISHYWYTQNYGLEKRSLTEAFAEMRDLEAGPEANGISMPPYWYLRRGQYLEHIRRYQKLFGVDNTRVVVLENFLQDGAHELRATLDFLGLDGPAVEDGLKTRQNASEKNGGATPPEVLERLARFYAPSVRELDATGVPGLSQWLSMDPVHHPSLGVR